MNYNDQYLRLHSQDWLDEEDDDDNDEEADEDASEENYALGAFAANSKAHIAKT